MRPHLLDLFCGAGGAAMGYHRAGFDVVGVDIEPQPNYPFEFWETDALEFVGMLREADNFGDGWGLSHFDAIHASPPCQSFSILRHAAETKGANYPDLLDATRQALEATGRPWVIENVPGSPLQATVTLCGSMFGLRSSERQLRRHRLFETNIMVLQPSCQHRGEALGVYGGGPRGRYTFDNGKHRDPYNRRGGYQGRVAEKREAMGIDWMNQAELNQAIPPAYTEHIGPFLLAAVNAERRARCAS